MQKKTKETASNLTDEDVLKEFVKRFQCDGAVLIYLDESNEYGFGRWNNGAGRNWVDNVFKAVKGNVLLNTDNNNHNKSSGLTMQL